MALREAWPHEAHDFTPWLAADPGRLDSVLGASFEVLDTEALIDGLQPDILARDRRDGSLVVIENQLEIGDSAHLGRVLSYRADRNARTAIWIAAGFRPTHLAVLRDANAGSRGRFRYFAVRVRVARIGNSPLAPIFEVVEAPRDWRAPPSQHEAPPVERAPEPAMEFWRHYISCFPDEAERSRRVGASCRVRGGLPARLAVGLQFLPPTATVFVRGLQGVPVAAVVRALGPFAAALQDRLGVTLDIELGAITAVKKREVVATGANGFADGVAWLRAEADRYEAALRELLGARRCSVRDQQG